MAGAIFGDVGTKGKSPGPRYDAQAGGGGDWRKEGPAGFPLRVGSS